MGRRQILFVAVAVVLVLVLVGYFVFVNFVAPLMIFSWSGSQSIVDGRGNVEPFAFEDSKGTIHLFWAKNATGNYDIYEKTFNGKSWSENKRLTSNSSEETEPSAVEDSTGTIHLFFSSNNTGNFRVFEMLYREGQWGLPVSIPHKLADYSLNSFRHPSAVIDSEGKMYLFFHSFTGQTENINDLFMMKNDGSGWGEQVEIGSDGWDSNAIKDSNGDFHIYCSYDPYAAGTPPSVVEWTYDGLSWNRGYVSKSIPSGYSGNRDPSSFLDSKGNICLFYSEMTKRTDYEDFWRIWGQVRTYRGDWTMPVEITRGVMPAALQSLDGTVYLFYVNDPTLKSEGRNTFLIGGSIIMIKSGSPSLFGL